MKRLIFPIILFLILVCEGIAIEILPASLYETDMLITPHWVFVFLLLITLLYDTNDTYFSIIYSIVFGLLIDVVYTNILGVYMFVYPFTLYLVHLMKRFLQTNIYMTILLAILSLFVMELLLFVVFSIVGPVHSTFSQFISNRFIPTLIANILFLIPVYLFSAKKIRRYSREQLEH